MFKIVSCALTVVLLRPVYRCRSCGRRRCPPCPRRAIQDNSFFIEEAYNQEAGVVQHIFATSWLVDQRSGEDERDFMRATLHSGVAAVQSGAPAVLHRAIHV